MSDWVARKEKRTGGGNKWRKEGGREGGREGGEGGRGGREGVREVREGRREGRTFLAFPSRRSARRFFSRISTCFINSSNSPNFFIDLRGGREGGREEGEWSEDG